MKVEESDLVGLELPEQNKVSDHSRKLSTHYKELIAKTVAKNPHFVALVMALENDQIQPIVTTKGDVL